jgi:hypothetical protein
MASGPEPALVIGPYPFRIEPGEAESYRMAVGTPGSGVLGCMAARALSSAAALPALGAFLGTRLPVLLGQDMTVERPLRTDLDYLCEVRLFLEGDNGLRIVQQLRDGGGCLCQTVTSDIGLARQ